MNISASRLMETQCTIRENKAKNDLVIEYIKSVTDIVENLEGDNKDLALEMLEGCETLLSK